MNLGRMNFYGVKNRQLKIIGRSWEHNIMIFRILVDQTVIQLLLDFLKNIEAE